MDNKALKVGIISGIVSSLIVIMFIQPVLSLIWKTVLAIGGSLHQGYVDRIYRSAAVISPNPYGRLTLGIGLAVPLLLVVFWLVRDMESDTSSIYFPLTLKVIKVISRGLAVTAFFVIFGRLAILEGTMEIDTSFTQRLTVLAPAISDVEYKTLKARWAGMSGKADYDAIVTAMDRRATELGITLPPVRQP